MPDYARWMIGVLAWVVCGVFAYGLHFAFTQRQWPMLAEHDYTKDRLKALMYGLIGPMGLFIVVVTIWLCGYRPHGLKFR